MSLYEQIVKNSTKATDKKSIPNPLNAVTADTYKPSWFTVIITIQLAFILITSVFLGFKHFIGNKSNNNGEKVSSIAKAQSTNIIKGSRNLLAKKHIKPNINTAKSLVSESALEAVGGINLSKGKKLRKKSMPIANKKLKNTKKALPLLNKKLVNSISSSYKKANLAEFSSEKAAPISKSPKPFPMQAKLVNQNKSIKESTQASTKTITTAKKVENTEINYDAKDKNSGSEYKKIKLVTSIEDASEVFKQAIAKRDIHGIRAAIKKVGSREFTALLGSISPASKSDWMTAEKLCKESITQLKNDNVDKIALSCSDYFINRQEYKKAESLFETKLSLNGHSNYYARLAYLQLKNNNIDHSIQTYKNLLNLDFKNSTWWLGLGYAYSKKGENNKALDAYRSAYKYADKNAKYIPFLDKVLHNG